MKRLEFSLFADYFQFYLQDERASGDLSNSWNEEATARLLAVAPGAIGIGTVRNVVVPVLLEILEQEPEDDTHEWDHIVEASIALGSGRLVVAGCTDYFPDAARVEISPGSYRARVSYGALDSRKDALTGDDHYRVQLWPGPENPVHIVKQRPKK